LALSGIEAANKLIALPWAELSQQKSEQAVRLICGTLENAALVNKSGTKLGLHWATSVTAKQVTANVDIQSPPGLSQASVGWVEASAPLESYWSVRVGGQLEVKAKVSAGGRKVASSTFTVPWSFGLNRFGVRAGMELDSTLPDWPTLEKVYVHPILQVEGTGAIPLALELLDFQVSFGHGALILTHELTNLSIGLGDLQGRLTGELRVSLRVSGESVEDIASPGLDGSSAEAGYPEMEVEVGLGGNVSITLERVGAVSAALALKVTFSLPAISPLPEALGMLEHGLPRKWGDPAEIGGGATPPPPPDVDYATPAALIESGTSAHHTPNGTVFSIQHEVAGLHAGLPLPEPHKPAPEHYALEEDSAIWTGHYLAAEAFRHAATGSAEALARVKSVLAGIQLLFDVTTDSVMQEGGRRSPSNVRGIFARSALPLDSPMKWGEAQVAIENGRWYYEKPEGGWDVTVGTQKRHFPSYVEVFAFLSRRAGPGIPVHALTQASVVPVGRVWRGTGCGNRCGSLTAHQDHPVSRDQYSGVFMGLFAAHQLVQDPVVKETAKGLITQMLTCLLEHNWNVPLPPDGHICTSYIGNFNHQMAFLRIGATVDQEAFGPVYEEFKNAAELTWLPIWGSIIDPIPQYYKFNLAHAVVWPTLFAEDDETLRQKFFIGYNMLRRATAHHRNAYFNLLRILIERPENQAVVSQGPSGSNPHLSLQDEVKSTLAEWLTRWEHVKTGQNLPTSALADPQYELDRWPADVAPYTQLDGKKIYLCKFAMPVYGRADSGMDYAWQRSPFGVAIRSNFDSAGTPTAEDLKSFIGPGPPLREGPGVDYLLAYWLAVYLTVLPVPPA